MHVAGGQGRGSTAGRRHAVAVVAQGPHDVAADEPARPGDQCSLPGACSPHAPDPTSTSGAGRNGRPPRLGACGSRWSPTTTCRRSGASRPRCAPWPRRSPRPDTTSRCSVRTIRRAPRTRRAAPPCRPSSACPSPPCSAPTATRSRGPRVASAPCSVASSPRAGSTSCTPTPRCSPRSAGSVPRRTSTSRWCTRCTAASTSTRGTCSPSPPSRRCCSPSCTRRRSPAEASGSRPMPRTPHPDGAADVAGHARAVTGERPRGGPVAALRRQARRPGRADPGVGRLERHRARGPRRDRSRDGPDPGGRRAAAGAVGRAAVAREAPGGSGRGRPVVPARHRGRRARRRRRACSGRPRRGRHPRSGCTARPRTRRSSPPCTVHTCWCRAPPTSTTSRW